MAATPEPLDARGREPGELGAFIREQRRVGRLSMRKLAERAGVSNPYLSQIERGLRLPSAGILQQIARALEISSDALYVRAGILENHRGAPDAAAGIREDPHLTGEQKRALLHTYWTYRSGNADRAGQESAAEHRR